MDQLGPMCERTYARVPHPKIVLELHDGGDVEPDANSSGMQALNDAGNASETRPDLHDIKERVRGASIGLQIDEFIVTITR